MIILAIDLGKVRTGIALSDKNEFLASPLCVIEERDEKILLQKIFDICKKESVEEIVVGLPINMDGSLGESAAHAKLFAKRLKKITGLPVFMRDERGTTITAHNYLNKTNVRGRKRKAIVDCVAATIILQDYLDSKSR